MRKPPKFRRSYTIGALQQMKPRSVSIVALRTHSAVYPAHLYLLRAMAQLVFVIGVLLVASAWEAAEAHKRAVQVVPDVFSLKCIIHNVADRCVTVGISSGVEGQEVEAEPACWTPIGPIDVVCSNPVVHFCVTVTNDKGLVVTKSFPLNLLSQFKLIEPKCLKTLAITTCESFGPDGSKCIDFKIGREKLASLPL